MDNKWVSNRARTLLVQAHQDEYKDLCKEEKSKLVIPTIKEDSEKYYKLMYKVYTKAKVRLVAKYRDEFYEIKWKIRTGELE